MYWLVTINSIMAPGRLADYFAWREKFVTFQKSQSGYQAGTLGNSYSYPFMYSGYQCFESRDDVYSPQYTAEWTKFAAANSLQGIMTGTRPMEAYEDVFTVGDATKAGKCWVAVEWYIDGGKVAAFEQRIKDLLELRQKLGHGFCYSRLLRLMGNPYKYLVGTFYTSREDWLTGTAMPEFQQNLSAHPSSAYASVRPTTEAYEVVASN